MAAVSSASAPVGPAAAPASASVPARIRVATNDDYPPFVFIDGDGKPQGYEVDMWRLFQRHTGIQVDLMLTDWGDAMRNMKDGRADVIDMLYRTPSRELLFDFSAPYADLPVGIYADRRISGVRDVATLRGLPVGVQRGDACAERLQEDGITSVQLYGDYQDILQAATKGDLRVFCMDQYPADYNLYRYSALNRFYEAFVLFTEQSHWAVRKGDTAMFLAIQHGMSLVTPDERATLRKRWLDHPSSETVGYQRNARDAGIALAVLLLLAMLMALWVWTLRRTVAARTSALRSEEGKLRAIFDASPDAMWVKDLKGIYREGNGRAVALFHEPCEAPVGRSCDELFDAAFAAKVTALDREARQLGRNTSALLPLEAADGTERQLEVISTPLFTPQGELHAVMSAARDVTERLLAEAQLRLWAHAFQNAAFGMYICDARSKSLIAANPTFASERGYAMEEMVGLSVDALYPPDLVAERAALRATVDWLDHYVWETEHVAKDGRRFPVWLDCSVFHDTDGSAQYVFVHAQDITERKRVEGERRLAAVAFETQEALMVLDADRVIQRVNQAFITLTGHQPADVVGRHVSLLRSKQNDPEFYESQWSDAWHGGFWQGEMWIQASHGQPKVVRITTSVVTSDAGQLSHFVCSMIDLTSEREAHASVDRMTYFDSLTDLPNRRFLYGQLQHMLGESGTCMGALLLFDLDHFKRVNDLRGHAAGDRLLALVAQRLRNMLDDDCVLSRFGGGTFALALPTRAETPAMLASEVLDCAERMRQVLREPFRLDGEALAGMTISLGWAELVAGCDTPETVLKQAELAMYAAKAAGRDRVRQFESEMQVALARRETLAGDLLHAIADEALELHFQAQADRRGNVVGAELLLRWTRHDGTQVSPDEFIPVAEENGLILPLGDWVLRKACAQLAAWSALPGRRDLSLAINVSARQFLQPGFVDNVQRAMVLSGADPSLLTLEITETAILDDLAEAADKLARLRAMGLRISLDDFGTGYSSLAYLSRLPLDELKIDQAFVARLPEDANDAMVAQTIVGMGRGLSLQVVAEGVETEAQRNFLMTQGCDIFQGYLISRPMPLRSFEQMLGDPPARAASA
nr:EAL domain-containing protein [Rhodanobacter sp. 7MK24]